MLSEDDRQNNVQFEEIVDSDRRSQQKVVHPQQAQPNRNGLSNKFRRYGLIVTAFMAVFFVAVIGINTQFSQSSLNFSVKLKERPPLIETNLWDMNATTKRSFLKKHLQFEHNSNSGQHFESEYQTILNDKDEEAEQFIKIYEQDSQTIDWYSSVFSEQQNEKYARSYKDMLAKRKSRNLNTLNRNWPNKGHQQFMYIEKGIRRTQIPDSIERHMLNGEKIEGQPQLIKIYEQEKQQLNKKYSIDQYKTQLPACIISPTFNNEAGNRSVWHLQSISQQEYSNYRLIIIDDNSQDRTVQTITRHLKWRNISKDKVVLIHSKKHRTTMENIYYAAHKYCDYNQILYIIDGDDQLVGRQVFKTQNALYQRHKYYAVYSQYVEYNEQLNFIKLGSCEDYPQVVKDQNRYRSYPVHANSHLRTMLSDLFLLTRARSFQDWEENYYWTLSDKALYFPAMQMACTRVKYIPEIFYFYSINTGLNDYDTSNREGYKLIAEDIEVQKTYHCIEDEFRQFAMEIL